MCFMNTKKIISASIAATAILTAFSACGDMNESYKDFIGDMPIVYLGRNNADSIKVQYGRERVKITVPPAMDPRIEFLTATWRNGEYMKKVPVVYKDTTVFIIDENLPEGMYDFVLTNHTEDGLYSISASVVGQTYGKTYESYLRNRNIQKIETDGDDVAIHFPILNDSTILGTEMKWTADGAEKSQYFPNTADNKISITGFPISAAREGEFQYRVWNMPNKEAIDTFYSEWKTCRFRIEDEVVAATFDPDGWTATTSYETLVDGSNGAPSKMFDGQPNTFMSIRKPGKNDVPADAECSFVVDMKKENTFDFFDWYHRGGDTQLGLRAWGITVSGSNDGEHFTSIAGNIVVPGSADKTVASGRISLPESTYRYIKVEFVNWDPQNNSAIQVGELKVGYSKTPTGKGLGVIY